MALLEAMASGLPCIASRIDGATDVMIEDGVNGRLVARDDEHALAAALIDVLSSPLHARTLGEQARRTVIGCYDVAQTAERWLDAYREVMS